MSSSRASKESGYPHGFKAQSDRIAVGIRYQLGLADIEPLDPYAVADRLGIRVCPLTFFRSRCPGEVDTVLGAEGIGEFSALYWSPGDGARLVVLNDSHSLARQNSSLCHEIAHALLGHPAEVFHCWRDYQHSVRAFERQADFLAGCMLIPNAAADHIMWSGLDLSLARDTYGVSARMLEWRLNVSGARTKFRRYQRCAAIDRTGG